MKKIKFAFIGCGKISNFHAEAIERLGHQISVVVARRGSKNIDSFCRQHKVAHKILGLNNFLNKFDNLRDSVDCILVCTPWFVTQEIILDILNLGKPVMAEKPVVLSMGSFRRLAESRYAKNLLPAYNRRYYDFMPMLRKLIQHNSPLVVDILSAEPLTAIMGSEGKRVKNYMPYFYTSHIIDLLFSLLGDVTFINKRSLSKGGSPSWFCCLDAGKKKIPVNIKILMDSPQNSYLRIYFKDKVAELCPLERLTVYKGLEMKRSGKITRYLPNISFRVDTNQELKPGFLNQTAFFVDNFVMKNNSSFSEFKQLGKVTAFCDNLTGR